MIRRGEVHWANLPDPEQHKPGYRRPVVVVQSDFFNASGIPTVLVVPLTTSRHLAKAPGNITLAAGETGLAKDSIAVISQITAISRSRLDGCICELTPEILFMIDNSIRLVLDV